MQYVKVGKLVFLPSGVMLSNKYKVFDKKKDAEEWLKRKHIGINCSECTSRFVSKEELEQILKHAYRNR